MEKSIKLWMESLANRKTSTKELYIRKFKGFIDYTGKTADQLRQMKYLETQNTKPWERSKIENLVKSYLQHLKDERGLTNVENPYYAIRSFFSCNGLPLNFNGNDMPKNHSGEGSSVPTAENIRKVVEAAEYIRDRAMTLFLKDSGLRASDLPKLNWESLIPIKEGFYAFKIVTEKDGVLARGFVGPEAVKTLELYRKKRLEGTRRLPSEKGLKNHPVFALLNHGEKVLTGRKISARLCHIFKLAGMRVKNVSVHGLRKFWEQNMHAERESYIKQMNGGALSKVEKAYHWRTVDQLFEIYQSNYNNLRVLSTPITHEVKQLEERLRKEFEKKYRVEIEELKKQLAENTGIRQALTGLEAKYVELLKRLERMEKQQS